ncbi:MAG: NADP-dependent isocitrate dehydrogenase [Actinomyces sp.]|uniref:NADP-dependent isocitrate dehydrogenase n=1 Tax=Actinomyces sp. TaxID=29317 RepID=UPI0026DB244D|nr:NADP-dependent isocitrate dehydrogenase [Actinomyces sp.]MDO4242308.1 NADP-dependent isocitrate dehydrogenase [Actinomyces sp.]
MTPANQQDDQRTPAVEIEDADLVYTLTDEAPMLATHSLLPIIEGFARAADVSVARADISLAGRIMAAFGHASDDLARLGALTQSESATIIKLPNISASVPQLKKAIAELQALGVDVPDYPESPSTEAEREVRAAYDAVKGSAVNPVLREGNSDRRASSAVKAYARSHPHSMGEWSPQSRTRVATMDSGDFRHNEISTIIPQDGNLRIRLRPADGSETIVLRDTLPVTAGEVIDATFMSACALDAFLVEQVAQATAEELLLSVHLKATMMKVSDPLIFGHAVRAVLPQTFTSFGKALEEAGLRPEDGLGSILAGLDALPDGQEIRSSIAAELAQGPGIAMVDSDNGITNLHVPSDVIIDASMPAMIRSGGKMWDPQGQMADTLAVIPDSSYAGVYAAVVEDCKTNGALDPATMGSVPNVGLMARKAEEYGSHDKTFLVPTDGIIEVVVVDGTGLPTDSVLLSHEVESGDIWRACQTQDAPVRDWVRLAVTRARVSGAPAVFWLDPTRGHDRVLASLVGTYLAQEDTEGLDIRVLDPVEATRLSLERARQGQDTISVTGNVLRDYNTDLFPILELGTSAKMLSVVPLMNGGGLYETGAGGSAPKHVRQLLHDNYLRWDSLGEFLALAEALRHVARVSGKARAAVLADALDAATTTLLAENRSPGRRLGTIDNRGSHAWLARYWAAELASQEVDADLAARFSSVATLFQTVGDTIQAELAAVQGQTVEIGGYYCPNEELTNAIMRPSATLNAIVDML